MLATSQIAKFLFLNTRFITQFSSEFVVLVNGHPKCSAASTEVTTLKTCVLPIISYPKTIFNISKSPPGFSQFKAQSKQQMTQQIISAFIRELHARNSNCTLTSVQKLTAQNIQSEKTILFWVQKI
jgi:hypothetical protein